MKSGKPKPIYLIAGGPGTGSQKLLALFRHVLSEFDVESPCIAYLGAASDDDQGFFHWLAGLLMKAGAGKVVLAPVTGGTRHVKEAKRTLCSTDMIFVSGGDVEKGMELLAERGIIPLLNRLYKKGVPFFGLSAGSIMLAKKWVKWGDPDDESTAELFQCLGFAPVFCDTHAEDDGWEELYALLRLSVCGTVAYGITSSAALRVSYNGRVRAIGGKVYSFEKRKKGILRRTVP
jgi:peptidase E